jgi:hypothetical protein
VETAIFGTAVTLYVLALMIPAVLLNNLLQAIPLNYCARKVGGINSNYLKCFSILNLAALVYILMTLPMLWLLVLVKSASPIVGGLLWICLDNFFYLGIWLWSARLLWDCDLRLAAKASLPVGVFVGVIGDYFLAELAFMPFYPNMVVWAIVLSLVTYIFAFIWAYAGGGGHIATPKESNLEDAKSSIRRKSGEIGVSPWPVDGRSKKTRLSANIFQIDSRQKSRQKPVDWMGPVLVLVMMACGAMALYFFYAALQDFGFFNS